MGVEVAAAMVSVVAHVGVQLVDENDEVAPVGMADTLKDTDAEALDRRVAVIGVVTELP